MVGKVLTLLYYSSRKDIDTGAKWWEQQGFYVVHSVSRSAWNLSLDSVLCNQTCKQPIRARRRRLPESGITAIKAHWSCIVGYRLKAYVGPVSHWAAYGEVAFSLAIRYPNVSNVNIFTLALICMDWIVDVTLEVIIFEMSDKHAWKCRILMVPRVSSLLSVFGNLCSTNSLGCQKLLRVPHSCGSI